MTRNLDQNGQCQAVGQFGRQAGEAVKPPVRVVRVRKRKRRPKSRTVIPSESSDQNKAKRPNGTSLAFHGQGHRLQAVPLVEKKTKDEKFERLTFLSDGTADAKLTESAESETATPQFGKVTFEEDGSINIKLVDSQPKQNIDHLIEGGEADKRQPVKREASDPGAAISALADPAGSSHQEDDSDHSDTLALHVQRSVNHDLANLGKTISLRIVDKLQLHQPKGMHVHTTEFLLFMRGREWFAVQETFCVLRSMGVKSKSLKFRKGNSYTIATHFVILSFKDSCCRCDVCLSVHPYVCVCPRPTISFFSFCFCFFRTGCFMPFSDFGQKNFHPANALEQHTRIVHLLPNGSAPSYG